MDKNLAYLQRLLTKYLHEAAMDPAELQDLYAFVHDKQQEPLLENWLAEAFADPSLQERVGVDPAGLFERIQSRIESRTQSGVRAQRPSDIPHQPHQRYLPRSHRQPPWYSFRGRGRSTFVAVATVAATVLIVVSIALYVYFQREPHRDPSVSEQWTSLDIAPAKSTAYLTLADGRRISLSESQRGIQVNEQGISYLDGSELAADAVDWSAEPELLELETEVGGFYQLSLPDGSRVWLNATSKLTYPSRFTGGERRVHLEGEGYFEVVQSANNRPFIVQSGTQRVEVLGTHFNIQAYVDDPAIRTTLLEGSVRVSAWKNHAAMEASAVASSSETLVPNQQSVYQPGQSSLQIRPVDAALAIAWKSGLFHFHDADLQTVMREIARWYDLEIEYRGVIPQERYHGKVYRNMTLGQVLDVLSFTNLKYELDGRKLIIHL